MNKVIITLIIIMGTCFAQTMETYCCTPPYVVTAVKPNINFCIDMTGSMRWRAANSINNGRYDPNRTYYGYFEPDHDYWYQNKFYRNPGGGRPGPFPGNIMNWAVMSRIDIVRKVLVGGKGVPASQYPKNTLNAEGSGSYWGLRCRLVINVGGTIYKYTFTKPSLSRIRITAYDRPVNAPDTAVLPYPIPTGTFTCNIETDPNNPHSGGVIRQICDKNLDDDFDEEAPRVALQFFSTGIFEFSREFYQSDGTPNFETFITDLNSTTPSGNTPVAKAVFDAICNFSYVDPRYGSYICHGRGHYKDPYYSGTGVGLEPVWCRKSFVIMLGDGESNSDWPVVNNYALLPNGPFARSLYDYDNDNHPGDYGSYHPADDYAYYGHITDLRPDLDDMQNVEFYSIFCFGAGSDLFKEIAKDGGFDDQNDDHIPQLEEYDKNGDGVPDNYFAAEDGHLLELAILKIIQDIFAKVSSSSGVSVVTTGSKAGGITVQAQFYPKRNFPTGEDLDWIGTCQSLWIDKYGWLREDNQADAHLHLQNDYVVNMQWSKQEQNVIITRLQDVNGNGVDSEFVFVEEVPIENLKPVWDAGKILWNNPPGARTIFTFVDADQDGVVDPGEIKDFVPSNNILLRPYLGVATDEEADTIIQYVRGTDFPDLRTRTADSKVWKLGDIISSGAVAVQSAIERYDFIYGDQSYIDYYDQYKDRRQTIYVGANDGMLHCFNGGVSVELADDPMIPMKLDPAGYDLGEELWSYIPYNLLPHLKWLKDPIYCHVYYNDLTTYVTDVQIFVNDATHPNGWGTILIGGMKLGGRMIVNDVDTCYSSYFAIDITDPLNPVPMWEFTAPDVGLTVCYSTVAKVDSSWFLVFGSGPGTCGGESVQRARIFVLDLKDGTLLKKWILPDDKSFITNIFGADWGMDYTVDRIYLGTCHEDKTLPGNWGGKIYRILTNDDTDPNTWDTSMVFDMQRPITSEGSIATDDYNHLWIYFGSGRFFSEIDEGDYTTQYYIGIREDTTRATTVAGLLDVTDIQVDVNQVVHYGNGATSTFDVLIDTVNVIGGWCHKMEGLGERNLTTSLVFGGAVLFTSFLPTGDICSYGGHGNLYALFYRTGTAYVKPFLKLQETSSYHPKSVDLGQGMPSEPSLYVSADQTKVFIQAGGGIVSPETGIPGLPKSGVIIWKGR
ncbi:MAG: PilC/PilY family type IV pilus protein [bacterium]